MILSRSSCIGAVHCVNQTVAVVGPSIIKHSEVVVFVVHGHVSVWYCYIFQIVELDYHVAVNVVASALGFQRQSCDTDLLV